MKKSDELKLKIKDQRKIVTDYEAQQEIDKAAAEAKVLAELQQQYNVALALEESEFKDFTQTKTAVNKVAEGDAKKIRNRAFNRVILDGLKASRAWGKPAEAEQAFIDSLKNSKIMDAAGFGQNGAVNADGGYLIPTEQFNQILEYRRIYQQLKQYCTVRAVTSRKGTQPTVGYEDATLTAFEELNEITQSKIDFGQITFATTDYGDIIPVARQLLQDIDTDLIGLIGDRFAKKAVNTENTQILAIVNALTKTAITDYKGITSALNVGLDPAISLGATIFTNQDGYDYLDNLVDTSGRPMLTTSIADPRVYLFKGRPIVVLKNTLLASDTSVADTKKLPFVVGSLVDLVYFWDRVGLEIAASDEAGFTKNAVLIRAIERFGVTKFDADAVKFLQLSIAD